MSTQTNPTKIIKFTGVTDAGEYGNATCPHCGADGRYVYHFVCVDGSEYGAMAGCVKHFPVHSFAKKQQAIMKKEIEYQAKGWTLPTWDTDILEAIDKFAAGEISESLAALDIRQAEGRRNAYQQKKFGYGGKNGRRR